MSNTSDFKVKNGLSVGTSITAVGSLTTAGQTFPAADGSTGQYLKTDGSGALSWGTVSTSFNITDGTTTDTVGLTETVTFTGGTNITLAVTDNTVTINNDHVNSSDITENTNLFFTDARAIAAVQAAADLTIDGGTIYVDTSANRVGISDTSPQQTLDVAGNIGVNGTEVINASSQIVGAVLDSALTVGGSLAGVLSNLKVQYGTAYSGTPIQGSFFFDSLNQKLKVYTGSAFVDAVPAGSGGGGGGGATDANTTFRNYSYTLTGTTSAVTGADDNEITAGAFIVGHKYTITATGNTNFVTIGAANSNVNTVFTATGVGTGTGTAKQTLFYDTTSSTTRVVAYVNGIKQVYGSGRDFVATTGTSVAFTYNLGSGDTVDLQVYELLTNAAYYLKTETLATTAVNSNIATAVADYLPLAGGTLTGNLTVQTLVGINKAVNSSVGLSVGSDAAAATSYGLEVTNNSSNTRFLVDGLGSQRFYGSDNSETARFTDGKLGIGTDAPGALLDLETAGNTVDGTYYSTLTMNNTGSSTYSGIRFDRSAAAKWRVGIMPDDKFQIAKLYNTVDDDAFVIDNNANIGIGTNTPNGRLTITGGQYVNNVDGPNDLVIESANTTGVGIRLTNHANKNWFMYHGGTGSWVGSGGLGFVYSDGTSAAAGPSVTFDSNGKVGIGISAPVASLDLQNKTDAIILPRGTTAQRPSSPVNGMIRYNTTISIVEEYRNGQWAGLSNVFTAAGGTESTYSSGGVNYKVHTFTSSGNFTVQSGSVTVDYLAIAGGGGGGGHMSGGWYNDPAGGGGAGGMITGTMSVTSGSYSVTIGAGGVSRSTAAALNGGNTTFSSATAVGGGGGGAGAANNAQTQRFGQSGGSGGGGGGPAALQATATGGSGTSGQGNAGGFGGSSSPQNQISGGGGGKGAAGENAQWSSRSGTGGVGATNSLRTGSGVYYAGGGGGGGSNQLSIYGQVGGNGGGGRGGDREANSLSSTATAGAANTGGGGGGANASTSAVAFVGRNGGSGIVIIRYPV